ncbi:MAG: bifunctional adenosylcobinamide kinase/adenosylcobinamide-phosphate guanylyltransferase [Cellvibrionaceae bacterium]|nr:bifunctional adenosylcobinamide kinase/adenosylcobinamide-phosphate guanylyltransferase [Cellvibrionaceae bacterium]
MKHLILGGARSGKSRLAEQRAMQTGKSLVYIATAQARDSEMSARIAKHQQARSKAWHCIETPLYLSRSLADIDAHDTAIVIDCLTLWISNCMEQNCLNTQQTKLLASLGTLKADVFLVSNEVGSGVVPLGQLSRDFVDASGWLHQSLAEICDSVTLVVAGLPLTLKA